MGINQVSQLLTVSCTIDPGLLFYDVLHKNLFIFYFELLLSNSKPSKSSKHMARKFYLEFSKLRAESCDYYHTPVRSTHELQK
jgi:hypothetical protein